MSSLSIDEKMLLVQKMRNQAERMQKKPLPYVPARERETYIDMRRNASSSGDVAEDSLFGADGEGELAESFRFLKLRLFVCVVAFVGFFAMYKADFKLKGHDVAQVQTVLSQDMLPSKLQNSLETFSKKITENIELTKSGK